MTHAWEPPCRDYARARHGTEPSLGKRRIAVIVIGGEKGTKLVPHLLWPTVA